jgi:hypothetical protein
MGRSTLRRYKETVRFEFDEAQHAAPLQRWFDSREKQA